MEATLTIAEAAQESGLSAHTLRYWERAGLLQPVSRNGSGHRRYAEEDLERIKFLTTPRHRNADPSGPQVCGAAERGRRHQ